MTDASERIRDLDRKLDEIARTSETNSFSSTDYDRFQKSLTQESDQSQKQT